MLEYLRTAYRQAVLFPLVLVESMNVFLKYSQQYRDDLLFRIACDIL